MKLEIITEPSPILHKVSKQVAIGEIGSKKIQKLIIDLTDTLYAQDGVGIAAPQVNESLQVCIISKNANKDKAKDIILINPKWEKASVIKDWDEEGCLSVPKIYGQVKRYKKIKVAAYDESGKKTQFIAEGLFARVIQHEVDHLNGILFIEKAKNLHTID
ncbi:MAG: peptide deformylase [Patescibacteria group bacterium]